MANHGRAVSLNAGTLYDQAMEEEVAVEDWNSWIHHRLEGIPKVI